MVEILRTSGHKVLQAATGEEGARLLDVHATQIRVVVLDFVLPDIDGLKLIRYIRWRVPKVPVVLTSGYLSRKAGEALLASGRDVTFLAKPFRPSALEKMVKNLLQ